MKNQVVIVFMFIQFILVNTAISQIKKQLLPVNPDLIEYYKNYSKYRILKSSTNEKFPTGYIPPYVQLPEYYESLVLSQSYTVGLPAKFDLRDNNRVTSIKNQGTGDFGGNCWAFSTLASIESWWLTELTKINAIDLSEHHMATCHGYSWGFGEGGNEYFPMAYLTSLKGPVKESDVPYNIVDTSTHKCKTNINPLGYFIETRWIYNNPALVKKMIMQYGGVSTNIHWDAAYFDAGAATFYSNSRNGPNHAITLIGWDDNMVTQQGKGAWIAKNSWGSSWARNGYFYIAYGDNHILKPASFYVTFTPFNTFDTLMRKNNIGVVSFFGYSKDEAYALLKFKAMSEKYIKRIGTFIPRTGSVVEIDIYDQVGDTIGNHLIHYVSQPAISPGFYAYNIPLKVNGVFYVKIKYYTPGLTRPIPIEMKADIFGEIYADPIIQPSGSQWVSEDGEDWKPIGSDIKDWEANIVLHIYASSITKPMAYFETNIKEVCAGNKIVFTNKSIGNITSFEWNFGPGVSPSTATAPGPHTVSIPPTMSEQNVNAWLRVVGPEGEDTFFTSYRVVKNLTVLLGAPDYIKTRDTAKITAIADANKFLWYPNENLSDSTSKVVYFHTTLTGLHKLTVEAQNGNCKGAYTTNIYVKQPPINDDMCSAILLNLGKNGPFTNRGATVEPNEPHPADTSCYDELTWCNEGGLQNSVWFKVIGPSTGKMSIDTRSINNVGFDTQIAVYKSDTCLNIKFSDLVAANDDYYIVDPYEAAIYLMDVIPGKTYWIQVDGSAGGEEGDFYVVIGDGPLGESMKFPTIVNTNAKNTTFDVYPNPNEGNFSIKYYSDNNEQFFIKVLSIDGKCVWKKNFDKTTGDFHININIPSLNQGVYFILLQNKNFTISQKLFIYK